MNPLSCNGIVPVKINNYVNIYLITHYRKIIASMLFLKLEYLNLAASEYLHLEEVERFHLDDPVRKKNGAAFYCRCVETFSCVLLNLK